MKRLPSLLLVLAAGCSVGLQGASSAHGFQPLALLVSLLPLQLAGLFWALRLMPTAVESRPVALKLPASD